MTVSGRPHQRARGDDGLRLALRGTRHALLLALAACSASPAPAPPTPPPAVTADQLAALLLAGDLPGAETAVLPLSPQATGDAALAMEVGRVEMLRNELAAAEQWLQRALALGSTDPAARRLLAESYRRRDDFAAAAPLLHEAGDEVEAQMLASFAGVTPYEITADSPAETEVPFRQTDPLPVLSLTVNGKQALFLLDTGGSDLLLDPQLAAEVGAQSFGTREGTFGGGKKAATGVGRVESVALGGITVRHVPVLTLPTRRFGAVCGGCEIEGVLGTVLLDHFEPTFDYPGGKLILRRRGSQPAGPPPAHRIRFWMAGDHYMLALGRLDGGEALPFLVDTGLAGMAFTAPPAVFAAANIHSTAPVGTGIGGGGATSIQPVEIPHLSLGSAQRDALTGLIGPFPPPLETSQGVRIAGLVSHAFFRPWALTFDFDRMELRLTEPAAPAPAP